MFSSNTDIRRTLGDFHIDGLTNGQSNDQR
jgi:hypothetical protein